MRLNINLATEPYQDLGRFLRRWALAVGLFAVASIALAGWAWHQYSTGRGLNEKIRSQEQQIRQLDEQKTAATKMLAEPTNKSTADTAKFINQLIAKKSFSWTRVFMQLEQILPEHLHVLSLSPELTPNNQLQLNMRVAGNSREQAVELVRRIEKSPSFRSAQLKSESMIPQDQAKGTDSVIFEINALYVPSVAPSARPVKDKNSVDETADDESAPVKSPASTKGKEARP